MKAFERIGTGRPAHRHLLRGSPRDLGENGYFDAGANRAYRASAFGKEDSRESSCGPQRDVER